MKNMMIDLLIHIIKKKKPIKSNIKKKNIEFHNLLKFALKIIFKSALQIITKNTY